MSTNTTHKPVSSKHKHVSADPKEMHKLEKEIANFSERMTYCKGTQVLLQKMIAQTLYAFAEGHTGDGLSKRRVVR